MSSTLLSDRQLIISSRPTAPDECEQNPYALSWNEVSSELDGGVVTNGKKGKFTRKKDRAEPLFDRGETGGSKWHDDK
jgi:hypothetical protein